MATNYTPVGWDSTKYINPTNMNQMDAGIKAACDGVDRLDGEVSAVNESLENKYSSSVASNVSNTEDPNTTTLPIIRTKHANCPKNDEEYTIYTSFTDGNTEKNEKRQVAFGTSNRTEIWYRHKSWDGAWHDWEGLVLNSDLAKKSDGYTFVENVNGANGYEVSYDNAYKNDQFVHGSVLITASSFSDVQVLIGTVKIPPKIWAFECQVTFGDDMWSTHHSGYVAIEGGTGNIYIRPYSGSTRYKVARITYRYATF